LKKKLKRTKKSKKFEEKKKVFYHETQHLPKIHEKSSKTESRIHLMFQPNAMNYYLSITPLILITVILYNNYRGNKEVVFLAGYIFSICLYSLLHYFNFENDSPLLVAIFFKHFSPAFYMVGAFLYLYIRRSIKKNEKYKKIDLLHFIPFVVSLINILPYFFVPFSEKLLFGQEVIENTDFTRFTGGNLFYDFSVSAFIRVILFLGYSIASAQLLYKNWKNQNQESTPIKKKNLIKWLIFLNITGFVFVVSLLFLTIDFYSYKIIEKTEINEFVFTSMAGFTLFLIPIVLFFYPQVVYGVPISLGKTNNNTVEEPKIEIQEDDPVAVLANRIVEYFEKRKPFKNPDFSMDDLVGYLKESKSLVYKSLNDVIGEKFTDIRTRYRITHAKKLLATQDKSNITLQEIWTESGFSSKTNFFTTFKEETGMTPTEFIKNQKKKQTKL
jgi:AraC-like DNA-binding protein